MWPLKKTTYKRRKVNFFVAEEIITKPEKFETEIQNIVSGLSHKEKDRLFLVFGIIHEQLRLANDFWLSYGKLTNDNYPNKDGLFQIKSNDELLIIYWLIITNHFQTKSIRKEVGQCLFYFLKETTSVNYEENRNINNYCDFNSFFDFFENRRVIYHELLGDLSNKDKVQSSIELLYNIVILQPLKFKQKDNKRNIEIKLSDFDIKQQLMMLFSHFLTESLKDLKKGLNKLY